MLIPVPMITTRYLAICVWRLRLNQAEPRSSFGLNELLAPILAREQGGDQPVPMATDYMAPYVTEE